MFGFIKVRPIIAGVLEPRETLQLESTMPTGGVIFSDGVEADFLRFDAGAGATVRASASVAYLVLSPPRRKVSRA